MSGGSIRLRLLLAAAVSVVLALAIAGGVLTYLFEQHVERRVEAELTAHLDRLIDGIAFAEDGTPSVATPPSDPRFDIPLSGLYWQVEDRGTGTIVRSRSLWDSVLQLPADDIADGAVHIHEVPALDGAFLFAVEREVTSDGPAPRSVRLVTAVDHADIETAARDFAFELVPSLLFLAAILIVAAWLQVVVGLKPLERLRRAVGDVISGKAGRLAAAVPIEVQPLAGEINRLLDAQEKALARARSSAADLAHGLKTPLQVLVADVRSLRERGEAEIADEVDAVVGTIRRHVDRELARARAASANTVKAECRPRDVAERVVAVVKRTPKGEPLDFTIDAAPELVAPLDTTDLSEILGNLVENASRFAEKKVRIAIAEATRGGIVITVADDGPGIPEEKRRTAVLRGARLDLRGDGAGLGLAIVADVADAYGGTLELTDGAPGLVATVWLPARPATLP